MSTVEQGQARETLDAGMRATAACIPLDRLDAPLTRSEVEHVADCARCQAELALWEAMGDAGNAAADDSDAQWVTSEVRRRRKTAVTPFARTPNVSSPQWIALAVAASLALSVGGAYLLRDPEPPLGGLTSGPQNYRAAVVHAVAPVGDLAQPPRVLEWTAVNGSARYDAVLLEVDRTILWEGSSQVPSVSLPASIVARLVPGKTVMWEVTARDASGAAIADSGAQRFRVTVAR